MNTPRDGDKIVFLGRGYNDLKISLNQKAVDNRTVNMSMLITTESWKAPIGSLIVVLVAIAANIAFVISWYVKFNIHYQPEGEDG